MYLIFNELWLLRDRIGADDAFARRVDVDVPFDPLLAEELTASIIPIEGDCQMWIGSSYSNSGNRRPIPYHRPHRSPYPYSIPVRQTIIAHAVNIHYMRMPKIRVVVACGTPTCVAIDHIIPEGIQQRIKYEASRLPDSPSIIGPYDQAILDSNIEDMQRKVTAPKPTRSAEDLVKSADTKNNKED
jgi:hypothetical protein